MELHGLGLTETYNRFHDASEDSSDIQKLRELHVEMDNAVAATYGWTDLVLGHGFHETKQGVRFTISGPARREVLARLLKLNHEGYAEEVRQGLHEKKGRAKGTTKGTAGKRGRQSKKTDPRRKRSPGWATPTMYGISPTAATSGSTRRWNAPGRSAKGTSGRESHGFPTIVWPSTARRRRGGLLNVVDSPGAEVLGVIYLCDSQSMDTMDAWEIGYQRKMVKVTAENGEVFDAVTYVAKPESLGPEGRPNDGYLARFSTGQESTDCRRSTSRALKNLHDTVARLAQ